MGGPHGVHAGELSPSAIQQEKNTEPRPLRSWTRSSQQDFSDGAVAKRGPSGPEPVFIAASSFPTQAFISSGEAGLLALVLRPGGGGPWVGGEAWGGEALLGSEEAVAARLAAGASGGAFLATVTSASGEAATLPASAGAGVLGPTPCGGVPCGAAQAASVTAASLAAAWRARRRAFSVIPIGYHGWEPAMGSNGHGALRRRRSPRFEQAGACTDPAFGFNLAR